MGRDFHYRSINAKPLKPKTRAAMFGRRSARRDPPDAFPAPDLRHAVIEPVISRITPDVGGDVRIHLAAGVSPCAYTAPTKHSSRRR